MTDYTNISTRAMLVSVRISTWAARKQDKKVTQKVTEQHKANKKAGRWNKYLLPGAKEHEALAKRACLARDRHYDQTLPWSDENWRLLPTTNYFKYTDTMRGEFADMDTLLDDLCDAYPRLVREARAHHEALGLMFDLADYPKDVDAVRRRYRWSIDIKPVPASGDLRVDLPAEQLAAIERRIQEQVEDAARAAMQDAWERLHEAVTRVRHATGADGIVRATLIEHVRDVVDVLHRLNVSGDERLENLRLRVERELTTITVDDLRQDERLRRDTKRRADAIAQAMAAFYTPFQEEVA